MTVHRLADSFVDFRSDNTGAAAPEIVDALAAANSGTAAGYGNDRWTELVQRRFSELFEKDVQVFPVATGTAANALALASLCPPWGAVYCSPKAHIETSEANATLARTFTLPALASSAVSPACLPSTVNSRAWA